MKKIIFSIILFIILMLLITYIINIYLPTKIKSSVTAMLENFDKKIILSEPKITLFKGIIIDDILIYEKKEKTPYMKIETLRIVPFYPSLFSTTKVISSIELNNVYLIAKTDKETFNLEKLTLTSLKKLNFLVKSFTIKNLNIDFYDTTVNFRKKFYNLQLKAKFKIPFINFDLVGKNLLITGKYNIKDNILIAKIHLNNINLDEFKPYLTNIESGYIKKANFILQKKDVYVLKGTGILEKVIFNLPNYKITNIEDDVYYNGDILLENIQIKFTNKSILYDITGSLKNGLFKTPLENFTNVSASFNLNEKNLNITNLKTNIEKNHLQLKVNIKDFDNPTLYLEGNLNTDLSYLVSIFEKFKVEVPRNLQGNINLFFIVHGNILDKIFDYHIDYSLKNGTIAEFKNIEAKGSIQNNILLFKKATLNYKETPLAIKGYLKNFIYLMLEPPNTEKQPILNIQGISNLNLQKLLDLVKELKNFNLNYQAKGDVNIQFTLKGNPKNKDYNYFIRYKIHNGKIKDIKDIEATGEVKNNILILKNANLFYKDFPFNIKGTLENFNTPKISLSIENEILNIYIKALYKVDVIEIKELFVNTSNSKSFSWGKITLLEEPSINLDGEGLIFLSDILKILQDFNIKIPILTKLNPEGILNTAFNISGKVHPSEWKIKMNSFSEKINIYNINFSDTKILLYKDKEKIIISPLIAYVADGIIELKTKTDFQNKKTTINVILNDLDLKLLGEELKLKNKKLNGKVSLETYIETDNTDLFNKLSGRGKIKIKEGNIWEMNLLKGLGEFLFIGDFDDIKFTEGYSDLIFKDNHIIFENLNLQSLQMDLDGGGKISLTGDLHFMLFPRFNPNLLSAHEGFKKITTKFLGKTGLLIEIKGTVENPTYQMKSLLFSPSKLIEIKNFFRKLLNLN